MPLQHLRSATANKRPQATGMSDGQLAMNTASGSPGLFIKNNAGQIVKVGPVHVGATAPNATPASGGTTGNTIGEQWLDNTGGTYVFKVWDGVDWRTSAGGAGSFLSLSGGTLTGAVGIIPGTVSTPGLFFSGDTNNGIYSPGADQVGITTAGTGRVVCDASGRVLIGGLTASGATLLQVNSDVLVNQVIVGRGGGALSTNLAVGTRALSTNTTGASNTAIGFEALSTNNAFYNTAVGHQALTANTTGQYNAAAGWGALPANTTGVNNTAVGAGALFSNVSGGLNTAVGRQALEGNTIGAANTAVGASAIRTLTSGIANIGIGGYNSLGNYSPVFALTTENNRIVMGSSSVSNAYIQVAWTVVSDARDKTNFAPVPHGLSFVNALKPTAFQFKHDRESGEVNGPVRYGFLAQDILALEGENSVIIDADDKEKLRYNGESLVPVLVNAIQELSASVEALKTEIQSLKNN